MASLFLSADGCKDVCLEHATDDVDRHLREGTTLSDAGAAQEGVERQAHRTLHVTLVEHVQLVDDNLFAEAVYDDLGHVPMEEDGERTVADAQAFLDHNQVRPETAGNAAP
jgi:hypothetical protein